MTTHSDAARDELRRAVQLACGPVRDAGQDFGKQTKALREIEDLVDALRIAAELVQTAATLGAAATALAAKARVAVAEAMSASGCTSFDLDEARYVTLTDKERRAVISDRSAVPDRYWVTPERRIDLDALTAARLVGPVPGAELTNQGEKTISIRARERSRKRRAA